MPLYKAQNSLEKLIKEEVSTNSWTRHTKKDVFKGKIINVLRLAKNGENHLTYCHFISYVFHFQLLWSTNDFIIENGIPAVNPCGILMGKISFNSLFENFLTA